MYSISAEEGPLDLHFVSTRTGRSPNDGLLLRYRDKNITKVGITPLHSGARDRFHFQGGMGGRRTSEVSHPPCWTCPPLVVPPS